MTRQDIVAALVRMLRPLGPEGDPAQREEEEAAWATRRGTYVLPEIDDQVLVVFEHGDINRPIVIGALWSKRQEPVEINHSGKNNTKDGYIRISGIKESGEANLALPEIDKALS